MSDASDDADPLPGLPPAETLRAIDEQYTDSVKTSARRFAEQRVPLVRNAGRPVSKRTATDLVDDAHADTWMGILTWDPARCSLLMHLCGVIYDRTRQEILRGRKHEHVSVDVPANDPGYSADVWRARARASFAGCTPMMIMALTRRVADELRRLAAGDPDAEAILECWANGFSERWEVMALTGLTKEAFKAARKRLLSLADELSPELREAAQDLLRSVS